MTDLDNEYLSTAKVARLLGLSIGTVQNLVARGELQAVFTRGGHRRIFASSLNEYRRQRGYREQIHGDMICIMQEANDLDPVLLNERDPDVIELMTHPFDLLRVHRKIDVLFIDARNSWLQVTPPELMDGLQKKCPVYIYNSDMLPKDSGYAQIDASHLIPKPISAHFISGFLTGRSAHAVN